MLTKLDLTKGILNYGNTYRLKKLMNKAQKGGSYTIGFIGGSITQGSLASKPELCYAYRVYEWWVKNFPKASFEFVNAGIGATDSHFGAARVADDLLCHNPDFVVTEYSVNDENNEHFLETYEGLVRKVYSYCSEPALITMNNVCYDTGVNAEDQHVRLAKHYGFPAIGIKPTVYRAICEGNISAVDITPDNLHPNDQGHMIVASHITFFLDMVHSSVKKDECDIMLTNPLTFNTYEHSSRLNNTNSNPDLNGFIQDLSPRQGAWDCFKDGWTAAHTGDSITFCVKGTNLSVQYRKSYKHPAPIARLILDGNADLAITLDANFDETWGDKLFLTQIAEGLPDVEHEITVELIETHKDDTAPFYLAAILVSGEDF